MSRLRRNNGRFIISGSIPGDNETRCHIIEASILAGEIFAPEIAEAGSI
jgi:hypothetical protein